MIRLNRSSDSAPKSPSSVAKTMSKNSTDVCSIEKSAGTGPERPEGIPDDWIVTPTKGEGGTEYINPQNANDRVRVMPGNPESGLPAQQKPYVKDQNGGFRDVNGGPIRGSNPGDSPEAHIPYNQFKFRR